VDSVAHIREEVARLGDGYDTLVYETQGVGDATRFIKEYLVAHEGEPVRFYACGGDGTLCEVVNGAALCPYASVSCYPCGSGNDFVKYYGGVSRFLSIAELVEGEERTVDLITDGKIYAINVSNFGFDYAVCRTMQRVKRYPLLDGKRAYYFGIVKSVLGGRRYRARVSVDGKPLGKDGRVMLCTVACGNYVGGSYMCAPRSDNEDGLLEVCLATPVSLLTFARLIGAYAKGRHLDDPKFASFIHYARGKRVEVVSEEKHFGYVMDGELDEACSFSLEVVPGALRFAIPASAAAFLQEKKERQKESVEV
jgi:diacylglycerol kinase (ATP)